MEKGNVLNHPIVTDFGITILRMFIGGALFVKGVYFMLNMQELQTIALIDMPFTNFIASHYIVFAHIIGGICLFLGLLTRLAAVINIPVILGAVIFVHAKEGLFTAGQGLELTMFLLVVLCVIALTGSKLFAVDNSLRPKIYPTDNRLKVGKTKQAA